MSSHLRYFLLIGFTCLYLCFELAFNARLLDFVSHSQTVEAVANIEMFGRFLSGCAGCLFVFGYLLMGSEGRSPTKTALLFSGTLAVGLLASYFFLQNVRVYDWFNLSMLVPIAVYGILLVQVPAETIRSTLIWTLIAMVIVLVTKISYLWLVLPMAWLWLMSMAAIGNSTEEKPFHWTLLVSILSCTVIVVFLALQIFVEAVLKFQPSHLRSKSVAAVIMQDALRSGGQTFNNEALDVTHPDGKALVTTLPLLVYGLDKYQGFLANTAQEQIDQVATQDMPPEELKEKVYKPMQAEIVRRWKLYRSQQVWIDPRKIAVPLANRMWDNYAAHLQREYRISPESVPREYYGKVRKQMNNATGGYLPSNWKPDDKEGLIDALVANFTDGMKGRNEFGVGDETLPQGLSLDKFLKNKFAQKLLINPLNLPDGVVLKAEYANAEEFKTLFYDPYMAESLSKVRNAVHSEDTAHATQQQVLVPVLALFFSLVGGLTHLGKLCMLSAGLGYRIRAQKKTEPVNEAFETKLKWGVLLGVVVGVWFLLLSMDNSITGSPAYEKIAKATLSENPLYGRLKLAVVHNINVGQSKGYPIFEWIREYPLGGVSYGYTEAEVSGGLLNTVVEEGKKKTEPIELEQVE